MSEQNTVFNVNELDECDTGGGPWYENFLARISYDRDNEHRAVCLLDGSAGNSCAVDDNRKR
jgi:hypothetical protein